MAMEFIDRGKLEVGLDLSEPGSLACLEKSFASWAK